jgi:hypothetical protein
LKVRLSLLITRSVSVGRSHCTRTRRYASTTEVPPALRAIRSLPSVAHEDLPGLVARGRSREPGHRSNSVAPSHSVVRFAHSRRPRASHPARSVCGRPASRPHGQRDARHPALLTSFPRADSPALLSRWSTDLPITAPSLRRDRRGEGAFTPGPDE